MSIRSRNINNSEPLGSPDIVLHREHSQPSFTRVIDKMSSSKTPSKTTFNKSILAGALFGAAVTEAGVYSPYVILSQMNLTYFLMLKVFLVATAVSALVLWLSTNADSVKPPNSRSLGLFRYDGNVFGGLLLGAGMGLSGACPGTVLPQIGLGVHSGLYTLLGSLLGGIGYSFLRRQYPVLSDDKIAKSEYTAIEQDGHNNQEPQEGDLGELGLDHKDDELTLYEQFHIPKTLAILTYIAICAIVVWSLTFFLPEDYETRDFAPMVAGLFEILGKYAPIAGGTLIGFTQLSNVILTGNTLGVSKAYEQFGDSFWWLLSLRSASNQNLKDNPFPDMTSTIFALGSILGAVTLSLLNSLSGILTGIDGFYPVQGLPNIGIACPVIGGFLLTFGARLAKGCTSGHGISGMSQLSVASILTAVLIFAGGIGVTALMNLVGVGIDASLGPP